MSPLQHRWAVAQFQNFQLTSSKASFEKKPSSRKSGAFQPAEGSCVNYHVSASLRARPVPPPGLTGMKLGCRATTPLEASVCSSAVWLRTDDVILRVAAFQADRRACPELAEEISVLPALHASQTIPLPERSCQRRNPDSDAILSVRLPAKSPTVGA